MTGTAIPSPLLIVTDRHGSARPLVETVRKVLDGGARCIWFRDRDLEPNARHDLALECLAIVREAGGWLTVGGDLDLAAAIGADGVHLNNGRQPGTSDRHSHPEMPARTGLEGKMQDSPRDLEASFEASASLRHLRMKTEKGEALLVGHSAHSLADIRMAVEAGADYVTLSPIFSTPSKPGYGPSLGLDALRAASDIGIPVIALGGVGPDEARACREAGAAGVAVMGALMRAVDPAAETRRFLGALAPAI